MSEDDLNALDNARLRPQTGGALLDVGCYSVSLARWMYRSEPRQVQCQACFHPSGVDVHLTAMLQFEGRRLACLEASFMVGLQQTYSVVGERGVIDLPHDAFIPWEKDAWFTLRKQDAESGDTTIVPGADEYQLMVEHFVDAVRAKVVLEIDPMESVRNLRVLDALAKAARSGDTVLV